MSSARRYKQTIVESWEGMKYDGKKCCNDTA